MAKKWEEFQLDERDRQFGMVPGYPVWWTRKWIAPYQMDDEKAQQLIASNILGVFSWVTAKNEPVTAMLDYVMMDGQIHVTSTSNRAKYKAWSRNPAFCACVFNWQNDQESVNLRGKAEIIHDHALLRRFIRGLMANRMRVKPEEVPDDAFEANFRSFDAPDRAVIRLHVEKVVSYDGAKLRAAEREGIDLWGVANKD
ncbi:MAG: pyridoxamine 5'-phosphate oxidase family protein [Dehalococcoidia bacterium]|nr:pyridoxamine 5'-phosphate oxidase family protein [Dehalococcoidia bacterium]